MKTSVKYITYVFLPLVFGMVIYLLRPVYPNAVIDFSPIQNQLANGVQVFLEKFLHSTFGVWSLYSLPAACWAFSLAAFIRLRTLMETYRVQALYFAIVMMLIVTIELQQLITKIGTYDLIDLVSMLVAAMSTFLLIRQR